jgi:regulatory protein
MPERDPIEIAARSLRNRDRSRREIEERLAKAGVGEDLRADALETLERVGYVDDERFAVARAASLAGRGWGDLGIRHDLEGHAIAAEAVASALAALAPERERAVALAERLGRTARTAAQLSRKGFGEDALEGAFGDVLVARGTDGEV